MPVVDRPRLEPRAIEPLHRLGFLEAVGPRDEAVSSEAFRDGAFVVPGDLVLVVAVADLRDAGPVLEHLLRDVHRPL